MAERAAGHEELGQPWDAAPTQPSPARGGGQGRGFNLPYDVPANQYLNLGGQKFSKSLGVSWMPST